ncbi:beta-2-microglobulin-like [Etheostoma cragini]|uniref:beta-2-microglobulin-like n=1 Tax=Etheostoma cragini TaxID=417921 RepID=UPI00155EBEF0|nr:beta-2-microglobulin-like [Etheostoma cragini]XP_034719109.1 beta-2-microglobulin-like [Etheostoma cragini]
MKTFVCAVLLGILCIPLSIAKEWSPTVQVYSREPGHFDKVNTLICHVSGFHPPEITIELLKNEQAMPGAKQTDLAFDESWHYHLTKHVPFTPKQGDKFACRVTHMGKSTTHVWESDM